MRHWKKWVLWWFVICAGTASAAEVGVADGLDDLVKLSLTELMDIEVAPATLTEKNPLKTPASVTVITAEDIARTPARNLLDLMEIYVPGMIYMNHSVGPVPGIRGVIADRPYKFLVNVNGMNVNIKAHYGARLELLNWDMDDIARVEIIRGPGSVTYGPGAIGGVINIYTKSAQQAPGLQYGTRYWDKYDSFGNSLSFGQTSDQAEVFGYVSVVDTEGTRPDLFGVSSSAAGYMGTPTGPSTRPPLNYLSDYYDEPQVKAHVDLKFKDNWRLWARYNSASSALIQGTAYQYQIDGEWVDFRKTRFRYVQLALEHQEELTETWNMKSSFGFSSIDVHNVEKYLTALGDDNDKDNLLDIGWIWSENEYYTRFMFNYEAPDDPVKASLGVEASYDTIGPAWGDGADDGLRLSDGIISGPTSDAYGSNWDDYRQVDENNTKYYAVGNGWETWSHALLGEVNWQVNAGNTALISARVDKHSYTDYMVSPRAAWIHELQKDRFLKFIVQRSVRKNTEEELYMNHEGGNDNEPEILDSLEMIYSSQVNDALSFQASGFFNRSDVIAWVWDANDSRTAPVGELKTLGLELEALYKKEHYSLGVNHSFVKQLDWDLAGGVSVSGISYSDYYQDAGSSVVITSNGNDLNNWPNQATKLFGNWDVMDGKVGLHADLKVLWGFEGCKDGLDALEAAGGNASPIEEVRNHDAYDVEATANLSLTYRINKAMDLTAYIQNIPVIGDNKRYSYSSGFKKIYPDKVSWIEEPTVFGICYKARFK